MSADSTCSTSTATSSAAPSTVASSVLPDDDDVLLAFGIPPTPFSIRPRIQSVVNDARVQRDRDLREAAIPRSLGGAEAYRCVVCTLPGGTCEHSDIWARQDVGTTAGATLTASVEPLDSAFFLLTPA